MNRVKREKKDSYEIRSLYNLIVSFILSITIPLTFLLARKSYIMQEPLVSGVFGLLGIMILIRLGDNFTRQGYLFNKVSKKLTHINGLIWLIPMITALTLVVMISSEGNEIDDRMESFCKEMLSVKLENESSEVVVAPDIQGAFVDSDRGIICKYQDSDEYLRDVKFSPKEYRLWKEARK